MDAEAGAVFRFARSEFRKIDGCPPITDIAEFNPDATIEFGRERSAPSAFYEHLIEKRAAHRFWSLAEYNNSETFEWQRMRVSTLLLHEPELIPNAVLHSATDGNARAFLCLCATYCRALLVYCPLLWARSSSSPDLKPLHTARIGPYLRALQAILRRGAAFCDTCFKQTDVSVCGGCKAVVYCGRHCQRLDWAQHKDDCRTLAHTMSELGMVEGLFSSTMAAAS